MKRNGKTEKQGRMSQARISWLVTQQDRLDTEKKKKAKMRDAKMRHKHHKSRKTEQQHASIALLQNQIAHLKKDPVHKKDRKRKSNQKKQQIAFSSSTGSRFDVKSHHWQPMAVGNTGDDWISNDTGNRCVGPSTLFSVPKKKAVGEEDKPGGARMRRTSWVLGANSNLKTRRSDAEARRKKLRDAVQALQNEVGDGMSSITCIRELRKMIALGMTSEQRQLLRNIDKDGDGVISADELNAFLVESEKQPLTTCETMEPHTFVGAMSPHIGKWAPAPYHGFSATRPRRPVRWQDKELKLAYAKSCPQGMPTASSKRAFSRHVCNSHGIKCSGSDVFDYAHARPKNEKKKANSPHRRRLSLFW